MKVFITTDSPSYAKWIKGAEIVSKIEDAEIVIFTGGEDIYPGLYGESRHHQYTFYSRHRDNTDEFLYRKAVDLNKFIVGICRGLISGPV